MSYIHHILSAPQLSRECKWTCSGRPATAQALSTFLLQPLPVADSDVTDAAHLVLSDLCNGLLFQKMCWSRPQTDEMGLPIYTAALAFYNDSMSANKKKSNTLNQVMCGNLDKAFRNLQFLSMPHAVWRGNHAAFHSYLKAVFDETMAINVCQPQFSLPLTASRRLLEGSSWSILTRIERSAYSSRSSSSERIASGDGRLHQ